MWPFNKNKVAPLVRSAVPTLDQFLCLMIVEINAAQETYKEELSVIAKQYPLNGAVLELMTALTTIRRKEGETVFKIVKVSQDDFGDEYTTEHARNLTSTAAVNEAFQSIINGLMDGVPHAFDGKRLVVGNSVAGIDETTYRVEMQ